MEPGFCQLADIETPSGNFENSDVLSSSVNDAGIAALSISDVSVIPTMERMDVASQSIVYNCDLCNMSCANSSALMKHKVRKFCFLFICALSFLFNYCHM